MPGFFCFFLFMYRCLHYWTFPLDPDDHVPKRCGNCYACQMRNRAEWDVRLRIEALYSVSCAFVTYTYEDDYLCIAHSYDEFQRLHKRMRNDGLVFRFYHVSEFGEAKGRPHNHELMFFKTDFNPLELYRYQSYGIMDVGTVTPASVHYVTKWHVHPKYRRGESRECHGFTQCSKGIGSDYLPGLTSENIQPVINLDGDLLPTPRYYRRKVGYDATEHCFSSDFDRWHRKTGLDYSTFLRRIADLDVKQLSDQHVVRISKLE